MKSRIKLLEIAHARSGDKGDSCNIGLIAKRAEDYPVLVREVTAERVAQHFVGLLQDSAAGGIAGGVKRRVERFELPNIGALNFLLHGALDGGGTVSLRIDAQGKTLGAALLRMEIER